MKKLRLILTFMIQRLFNSEASLEIIKQTVSLTGTGTDQNFIIGCRYFLKKHKLPVRTKTYYLLPVCLAVIFLFPCDILVTCLCPTYQAMMV